MILTKRFCFFIPKAIRLMTKIQKLQTKKEYCPMRIFRRDYCVIFVVMNDKSSNSPIN